MRRLTFLLLLSFCFLTIVVNPLHATTSYTFDVNITNETVDSNPGDGICADAGGKCSLRSAIMEANALLGVVYINVPAGTYNLTLTSGAEEDAAASNDLDVNNNGRTLTITGAGTGQDVVINASGIAHRAFDIIGGANLRLYNLTITGGYSSVAGGGIRVTSGATLYLDHVIISGNTAVLGGGIYNAGTITGTLVSITSNSASLEGGGIYLAGTTNNSVSLTRSLIYGNDAGGNGGGIANWGNGDYSSPVGGTLYLENVTIGGNTAQGLGAGVCLYQGSRSYFVNCTIAYNASPYTSGAGIGGGGANSFDFLNTLVFQNITSGRVNNCFQIYQSSSSLNWVGLNDSYFNKGVPYGHNLEDPFGSGNDQNYCFQNYSSSISLDTTLTTSAALAGVGTYKLQPGSAAIDAGDSANFAALDVFGTERPQGVAPDIGAHEFTNDNEPPGTPVLLNPPSGSIVSGNQVKLYWQKATDPEGGVVTYRLQVAEDTGFTVNVRTFEVDENGQLIAAMMLPFLPFIGWGIYNRRKQTLILLAAALLMATSLFVGCGSGGGGTQNNNTVSFEVTGLDSGKTYYWRVIAVDDQHEASEPSETRSFTTR
jgi:hypothetical protein